MGKYSDDKRKLYQDLTNELPAAFQFVYDQVYSTALLKTSKDQNLAHDFTNVALIILYDYIKSNKLEATTEKEILTYVKRICFNKRIDHFRKNKNIYPIPIGFDPSSESPNAEGILIKKENYWKIHMALSILEKEDPIGYRIIDLRFFKNWRFDEIQEELLEHYSNKRSVMNKLSKVMKKLRELLNCIS